MWATALHDRICQASLCQIWCWSNWPCSTGWPQSRLKFGFMWLFSRKAVFVTCRMTSWFCWASEWRKCFPLWPGTDEPSFIYIEKGIPDLQPLREWWLFCHIFETCHCSIILSTRKARVKFSKHSRVPTWQHDLFSM